MVTRTYRELAWSRLLEVVEQAAHSANPRPSVAAALPDLRLKFDAAIDAVPGLAALLDRSEVAAVASTPAAADGSDVAVDPINRADEIVAQIAGKLHER